MNVRPVRDARVGVEDLGDIRVVHHGERLALVVETGQRRR